MHNLKIAQKLEDMELYGRAALRHFPKAEKHVSSAEIRQIMTELMRLTLKASRQHHKKAVLGALSVELDVMRHRIRVAMKEGHLPMKKYEVWSRHLDEVGRMVGGWIRSVKG